MTGIPARISQKHPTELGRIPLAPGKTAGKPERRYLDGSELG